MVLTDFGCRNKRIVELFFANQESPSKTKRAYNTECKKNGVADIISLTQIGRIIVKWREMGTKMRAI